MDGVVLLGVKGDNADVALAEPETVNIDYPKEMPLEALVEYVGEVLELRVICGDELRNRRQTHTTVFAAGTNGASLWRFCGGQHCIATAFEYNVKELTAP